MSTASQISPLLRCYLEISKGPNKGQKFTFQQPSFFIGRGSENDICLPDDPRLSRQHAEIKQINGDFYIVNLSQKNFILLDGEQIESEKLTSNSTLQMGESEFKFKLEGSTKTIDPDATVALSPTQNRAVTLQTTKPPIFQTPTKFNVTKPPVASAEISTAAATMNSKQRSEAISPPSWKSGSFSGNNSRVRFYVIIAAIGLLLYWLLSDSGSQKKPLAPRGSAEVQQDLNQAEQSIKQMDERISRLNEVTYKKAQENYIKGFRDYQQGNYARAKDHFQVVLSLDPENDLAKRYYQLSKIKYDERLQFNMIQGLRYREKKNYRMCRSSFLQVLIMIQYNKSHPNYIQASHFFEECDKALQGRF